MTMCFGTGEALVIDIASLVLPPKVTKPSTLVLLEFNVIAIITMVLTATFRNRRNVMSAGNSVGCPRWTHESLNLYFK